MASPYTMISTLSKESKDAVLFVRVTRIWGTTNTKTNYPLQTNVVLLDEEDSHILATIQNNQIHGHLAFLAQGSVYVISNFKVVDAPKSYRSVSRDLSLAFHYRTKIQLAGDTETISQHKFELRPFENIAGLVGHVTDLIDVTGMVVSHGPLETSPKGPKKIDVTLVDNRNKRMIVTLWEEKAFQFQDALATTNGCAAIVVITGLLAKNNSGHVTLSSSGATECYFNIDYIPLQEFRDDMLSATGKTLENLPPPVLKSCVMAGEEILKELTVQGILQVRLPPEKKFLLCLCEARITEILAPNGWYYNCCPTCTRKVRLIDQNYYCESCEANPNYLDQRYKLFVRVEDNTGSTTFTLFNKEAEQLIGVPAEKVISEIREEELGANNPAALNNIIGQKCVFMIRVSSYNTDLGYEDYTVVTL